MDSMRLIVASYSVLACTHGTERQRNEIGVLAFSVTWEVLRHGLVYLKSFFPLLRGFA